MNINSSNLVENFNHVLIDKVILFIGYGCLSKQKNYLSAKLWGVRVVIVCSELDYVDNKSSNVTIVIPGLYNHIEDENNYSRILNELLVKKITPNGVLTLWEDCGPLAAKVAEKLKLTSNGYEAASLAKSKIDTQIKLSFSGSNLGGKVAACNSTVEVKFAIDLIGFPAIIKLEHGSSAAGVFLVKKQNDVSCVIEKILHTLRSEKDCPGIGLGFGTKIILSEVHNGSEHDVDIVLWDSRLIASFVTDNGYTRIPRFSETTAIMPSLLDHEKQSQLIESAQVACDILGLKTGVFNIEFILTDSGPKVIDVNARMGGFYIRTWIKKIWKYDILEAALLCSIGVCPSLASKPNGYIAGGMILPSVHEKWIANSSDKILHKKINENIIISIFDKNVKVMDVFDKPWGNIACYGENSGDVMKTLCGLWKDFSLDDIDPEFCNRLLPSLIDKRD